MKSGFHDGIGSISLKVALFLGTIVAVLPVNNVNYPDHLKLYLNAGSPGVRVE